MGLIDVGGTLNRPAEIIIRFEIAYRGQRNGAEIAITTLLTLETDERIRIHVGNLIPVQFQRV